MRTCLGMKRRGARRGSSSRQSTNVVAAPIASALTAVLVTASIGHMPSTCTKTGFSFQRPL